MVFGFFDSPEIIRDVAKQNSISLEGTSLFYYEAHEMEFDGERWGALVAGAILSDKRGFAFREAT